MQNLIRVLIAAATLALLASCAATGENTGQEQTTAAQPDATAQPGVTAQPGQEVYSYPYGQAPSLDSYDTFDTRGGGTTAAYAGGQPGGQAVTGMSGGATASADRIVYFSYDSTDIVPESRTIIENNARSLTKNPQIVTQLEGHTDERGSREYNIALGERRANAVRQTMIAMGVSPQQIRVVSFGEERPAAPGQSERSYALNRRVEIIY
ncbi:MAG: peptidoglycan-associated lipoprotein Pal [Candidatus Competibacter sp.]|nr:peptidoglycan-associated lipoprotein Pal [Candidatus Competibacter sp.]MDG4582568.1 peptidoglycan-associated lipoprotein Pal [Candidatus Competibacter sp.]